MSKPARRKISTPKQTSQHKKISPSHKKNKIKAFVCFILIAILAAIPFSMGKYFEFNTPDPFDSGAYVYSAKHILDGAEIGVDEKPSAKLGTLLVNILGVSLFGFSETGPELIQMLLQAGALILMFIAMRKLFGTLPAAVGVIIASFYLSSPLIAKFGNVKEQYMIAFMVLGISCFVLHQLGGKWFWAFLGGAFISWAPLFKETGTTAIGAVGLFVVLSAILKNRTLKQTGIDILLLLAGAVAAIAPLYIWLLGWDIQLSLPYSFAWKTIAGFLPAKETADTAKTVSGYIGGGRKLVPFSKQWPIVLRYYWLLILPIVLATVSILARLVRLIWCKLKKSSSNRPKIYERFVLLFAAWWLLDMAFVWISPRSYEQYYLPLNASAAMLSGYIIALYCDKLKSSILHKTRWAMFGVLGFLVMIILSQHIYFGIEKSPHSGMSYGEKRKGYTQKLRDISKMRENNWEGPWEVLAEYIRSHSTEDDRIYVWGWYPGIYVKAQRFSSTAKACTMPRPAPDKLKNTIDGLLAEFKKNMPKFIIDSRKRHIPTERPPYELWPIIPKGFMGSKETRPLSFDKKEIARYDELWTRYLRDTFDEDEALRYEVLKPLREFVRNNYTIVRAFGQHILFKLKNSP